MNRIKLIKDTWPEWGDNAQYSEQGVAYGSCAEAPVSPEKEGQEFVNENLLFLDPDGQALDEEDLVGTGTVIRLQDGEILFDEAVVVMTGDIDGNGIIRNRDASMAAEIAEDQYGTEEIRGLAADVNGDGNINEADSEIITRYLVGKAEMD